MRQECARTASAKIAYPQVNARARPVASAPAATRPPPPIRLAITRRRPPSPPGPEPKNARPAPRPPALSARARQRCAVRAIVQCAPPGFCARARLEECAPKNARHLARTVTYGDCRVRSARSFSARRNPASVRAVRGPGPCAVRAAARLRARTDGTECAHGDAHGRSVRTQAVRAHRPGLRAHRPARNRRDPATSSNCAIPGQIGARSRMRAGAGESSRRTWTSSMSTGGAGRPAAAGPRGGSTVLGRVRRWGSGPSSGGRRPRGARCASWERPASGGRWVGELIAEPRRS